jgi:hypothetical protein
LGVDQTLDELNVVNFQNGTHFNHAAFVTQMPNKYTLTARTPNAAVAMNT